jgi:hypothetical protein
MTWANACHNANAFGGGCDAPVMSSAGKLHQRLWLFGNQTADFNPNDRIDPSGFPTKQR